MRFQNIEKSIFQYLITVLLLLLFFDLRIAIGAGVLTNLFFKFILFSINFIDYLNTKKEDNKLNLIQYHTAVHYDGTLKSFLNIENELRLDGILINHIERNDQNFNIVLNLKNHPFPISIPCGTYLVFIFDYPRVFSQREIDFYFCRTNFNEK